MNHFISRLSLATLLGLVGSLTAADFPVLPAFQEPPTQDHHPGQLIWADLFTEDTASCSAFYTSLFGWETQTLGSGRTTYTLFQKDGVPVAGMIHRPAGKAAKAKGTWIPYFSVENLDQTLELVTAKRGQIEVPARDFPNRGKQAIIRDNQGALLGLMETSNGDPGDYLPEIGEWIWAQLSVREPDASLDFYKATIGFEEAIGDVEDANVYDHVWQSGGYFRASVGQIPSSDTDANPKWVGFVRVSDVDATVEQASRLGGTIYLKPDPEIRDGNLAIILDPAGAAFVVLKYEPYTEAQP